MPKESLPVHNIAIIGGSYAGLAIAHRLLKSTLPLLKAQHPSITYTVTIITSSTHFYWTVGAPRAILGTDEYPLSASFLPIARGFEQYHPRSYAIIYGTVTALNSENRTLVIEGHGSVAYDSLVVAVGARSSNPLWSLHGGHEDTQAALVAVQAKIPSAHSILIAGGGSVGVETAGEFGHTYGARRLKSKMDITLVSGTSRLLPAIRADIAGQAQNRLEDMGVKVVHGVKVDRTEPGEHGKTKVILSNGISKEVDIYLDATGRRPHAPFVPSEFLDARGAVIVDEYLNVVGAGKRIWATGDVASVSKGGIFDIKFMTPVLHNNIEVGLGVANKAIKTYMKSEKSSMIVSLGPSGGVGILFDWRVFNWVVRWLKSKDMMFPKATQKVMGTE